MKNLVCPVSKEKIPEHIPRITAFYIIALLLLYVLTGYLPVLLFLLYDFFVRGINLSKISLLANLALLTSRTLQIKSSLIDKAPKLFAARIGAVLVGLAIVFHIANLSYMSIGISSLISAFAFLECVLNVCVACYIYTLVVVPIYNRK